MKGRHFLARLRFAINGIRTAWMGEASFRTQVLVAAGLVAMLAAVRPAAIWVAVTIVAAGLVLALEAVNAALESLADTLHPGRHPGIGRAKDMAAGAVLIASAAAGGVGLCLAYSALP